MFEGLMRLGSKIVGGVKSIFSFGKKASAKVHSISQKVGKASKYIKPFIPSKYSAEVDKGLSYVKQADNIAGKVEKGIKKAEDLGTKAKGVKSLTGALDVGKEAVYSAKNLMNSTRSAIERPTHKDPVKVEKSLVKASSVPSSSELRAIKRKVINDVGAKAVSGLKRVSNGDDVVAQATAMAMKAQSFLNKQPRKKGLLRR